MQTDAYQAELDSASVARDTRTQAQIADDFGVTASCVSQIKSRKTWRHLGDGEQLSFSFAQQSIMQRKGRR